MRTPHDLRMAAQKYRAMAVQIFDPKAVQALISLAVEYEMTAKQIEPENPKGFAGEEPHKAMTTLRSVSYLPYAGCHRAPPRSKKKKNIRIYWFHYVFLMAFTPSTRPDRPERGWAR